MTKKQILDLESTQKAFAANEYKISMEHVIELDRISNSLKRINETYCSCNLSEARLKAVQTRETQLENRAKAIIAQFPGLELEFQGDPRGSAIILRFPNKADNCGFTDGEWRI